MKKLLIALLFFSSFASAQTGLPEVSYTVPSIASMKLYFGNANRIHVDATNGDYAICTVCTADETNVFAGAGGRKWKKVTSKVSADSIIDGTTNKAYPAADKTKLSGIATGATNVTNTNQLTNGAGFITGLTFAQVTSKPTTLSGYGITDAASSSHTHAFSALTSIPTTISGYGITDAFTQTAADARYSVLAHTHTFSSLTSKPTTLSGYGITDAAALTHTHAATDITSGTLNDARLSANALNKLDSAGVKSKIKDSLDIIRAAIVSAGAVSATSTTTLTNKTMSGASNTFSNIPESAITNLVSDLSGKAASTHTHAESDVTNLVSDLSAKASTASVSPKLDSTEAKRRISDSIAKHELDNTFYIVNSKSPGDSAFVNSGTNKIIFPKVDYSTGSIRMLHSSGDTARSMIVVGKADSLNPVMAGAITINGINNQPTGQTITVLVHGTDSTVKEMTTANLANQAGYAFSGVSLGQFAATSSASLAGIINDEVGSNKLVFSDDPVFGGVPKIGTDTVATKAYARSVGGAGGDATLAGAQTFTGVKTFTPSTGTTAFNFTGNILPTTDNTGFLGTSSHKISQVNSVYGIFDNANIGTLNASYHVASPGDNLYFIANDGGTQLGYLSSATGRTIFQFGGTYTEDASVFFQVNSTLGGLRPPRMTTTQKNAITVNSETEGVLLYDATLHRPHYHNGTSWLGVASLSGTETFTNHTIDAGSNTITNLTNSNLSGSAGITGANLSSTITLPSGATGTTQSAGTNNTSIATTAFVNGRLAQSTLTDGSTITFNAATSINAAVTIAATGRTLTISNPIAGEVYVLKIIQDGTGSRTITTWPSGIKWPGGVAPTLTSTANAVDIVAFYYNGTNFYGNFNADYK